jgi:hypothetical protein
VQIDRSYRGGPDGLPIVDRYLIFAIAIFIAVMVVLKYFIAPAIVSSGGPIAALAVIGGCILLAYWIQRREDK